MKAAKIEFNNDTLTIFREDEIDNISISFESIDSKDLKGNKIDKVDVKNLLTRFQNAISLFLDEL